MSKTMIKLPVLNERGEWPVLGLDDGQSSPTTVMWQDGTVLLDGKLAALRAGRADEVGGILGAFPADNVINLDERREKCQSDSPSNGDA